jgi:hypothetical protein
MAVSMSPLRASPPISQFQSQFGLLSDLAGMWMGNGFNLVSLPDKTETPPFRLKLNATKETFTFLPLNAPVPNRGIQDDLTLFAINYFQMVTDSVTSEPLHFENGLWLNVPDASPAVVFRQTSVPHGNSLLVPVQAIDVPDPGGPTFDQEDSRPKGAAVTAAHLQRFSTATLPPGTPTGIPQNAIIDPNLILAHVSQPQTINSMVVLQMTTDQFLSIPFIGANAKLTKISAIFWIERVAQPTGIGEFMQLQYSQNITLNFDGIDWPHISVGTLLKL